MKGCLIRRGSVLDCGGRAQRRHRFASRQRAKDLSPKAAEETEQLLTLKSRSSCNPVHPVSKVSPTGLSAAVLATSVRHGCLASNSLPDSAQKRSGARTPAALCAHSGSRLVVAIIHNAPETCWNHLPCPPLHTPSTITVFGDSGTPRSFNRICSTSRSVAVRPMIPARWSTPARPARSAFQLSVANPGRLPSGNACSQGSVDCPESSTTSGRACAHHLRKPARVSVCGRCINPCAARAPSG